MSEGGVSSQPFETEKKPCVARVSHLDFGVLLEPFVLDFGGAFLESFFLGHFDFGRGSNLHFWFCVLCGNLFGAFNAFL